MLMAYLPQEKIVVEADLYSPPSGAQATPATPNASNRTFWQNVRRLNLDIATIVPIHGPVVPMSDFMSLMGEAQ
jgi:hypothetical protein